MVTEADVRLADGRTLHAYDTRADGSPAAWRTGLGDRGVLAARLAQHRLAA